MYHEFQIESKLKTFYVAIRKSFTRHFNNPSFVVRAIANPILESSKSKHAKAKFVIFPLKHKHD
jgi:hypothetical protein